MSQDGHKRGRFEVPGPDSPHEDLLEEIDALALDLAAVAEATASGRVPIAARADYLRAQAAHRRAVIAWATASEEAQFRAVREVVEEGRTALASAHAKLRR